MHVNPSYANIRYPNGREVTVSLRDLSPCPTTENAVPEKEPLSNDLPQSSLQENDSHEDSNRFVAADQKNLDVDTSNSSEADMHVPRPSSRANKGVPPLRYGVSHNELFHICCIFVQFPLYGY